MVVNEHPTCLSAKTMHVFTFTFLPHGCIGPQLFIQQDPLLMIAQLV